MCDHWVIYPYSISYLSQNASPPWLFHLYKLYNETSILHICLNYLGKLMKREHSFETEKTFNERKWYINYEISNVKVYKVANTFGLMKKTVYIVYISWAMQARFPT